MAVCVRHVRRVVRVEPGHPVANHLKTDVAIIAEDFRYEKRSGSYACVFDCNGLAHDEVRKVLARNVRKGLIANGSGSAFQHDLYASRCIFHCNSVAVIDFYYERLQSACAH